MKFSFFSYGFLAICLMTPASCHKHDSVDAGDVTIEIIAPREGQQFHSGEQVPIRAQISSTATLHGWAVEIRKKSGGQVLFAEDSHDHKKSFTLELSWKNTLTEHTDLILEVFAQIDHDGKKTSKQLTFHAHP
jgi:hypothetical protein